MAPNIPVERELLDRLARGGWRHEVVDTPTSAWLAGRSADLVVDHLARRSRPGTVRITCRTTGITTVHRVVAHPACEVCAHPTPRKADAVAHAWEDWGEEEEEPLPPIDTATARLAPLTDSRLGLLTEPVPLPGPDGEGFAAATARFAIQHPRRVRRHGANLVCGMAEDPETAQVIARVEGLERYCLNARSGAAVEGSYEDLAARALCPASLPLHSEGQIADPHFPHARFDPAAPLTWVWGYDLTADRPVLLPEELASSLLERPRLFSATSNGVAAHWSRDRAIVGATLELVERDAFMIHWLLRRSPPRLRVGQLGAGAAHLPEIRSMGYEVEIVDLSLDLPIPAVTAFGLGSDPSKPALLLGAGAAFDPAAAAEKALTELRGAVRSWRSRSLKPRPTLAADEIRRLEDHGAAYAQPAWRERASFLWSSREWTSFEHMPRLGSGIPGRARLPLLVERLRRNGLDLLALDLATRDVESCGIHVVRAIVPGLQPIGFGHFGVRLGGPRLYTVAEALGHSVSEAELNPDPHCFP